MASKRKATTTAPAQITVRLATMRPALRQVVSLGTGAAVRVRLAA